MKTFVTIMIPIVAVVISAIMAVISFAALIFNMHIQRKHDADIELRIEREQASKISIYMISSKPKVSNPSDTPIYNVFAFLHSNNQKLSLEEFIDNCVEDYGIYRHEFQEILPPGIVTMKFDDCGSAATGGEHSVPALLFTDSQNVQWYRHANGYLEKREYVDVLTRKGLLLKHV